MAIRDNILDIKEQLPGGTRLVAVSKYRPVEELQEAYDAGQRVFAESRPAEFAAKADVLPRDIEWHFIGHLQTNKLKLVLPRCTLIHSVDSIHLLDAIQKYASDNGLTVNVLIEVHIGAESTKQGFSVQETEELFSDIPALLERYPDVRFRGLMGMASHTDDTARIDSDFATLKALFDRVKSLFDRTGDLPDRTGDLLDGNGKLSDRTGDLLDGNGKLSDRTGRLSDRIGDHDNTAAGFTELSAGMSDDWQIALRHGSTLVRIGSAIFLR